MEFRYFSSSSYSFLILHTLHSNRQLDFVFRFNFQWKLYSRMFCVCYKWHRIREMGFHTLGETIHWIFAHWPMVKKENLLPPTLYRRRESWKIDIIQQIFFSFFFFDLFVFTFVSWSRLARIERLTLFSETIIFLFLLLSMLQI